MKKSKAKQVLVEGRALTVLEELDSGSDKRVYLMRDDVGQRYVYKYCKKSTVKKELARAAAMVRLGLPHARVLASGTDYIVREWIEGTRGDVWLKTWESLDGPTMGAAIDSLVELFDMAARQGAYIGKIDLEDIIYSGQEWVIIDSGSITENELPQDVAERYFWKLFTRWGERLKPSSKARLHWAQILQRIGVDLPPLLPPLPAPFVPEPKKDVPLPPFVKREKKAKDDDEDDEDDDEGEDPADGGASDSSGDVGGVTEPDSKEHLHPDEEVDEEDEDESEDDPIYKTMEDPYATSGLRSSSDVATTVQNPSAIPVARPMPDPFPPQTRPVAGGMDPRTRMMYARCPKCGKMNLGAVCPTCEPGVG